jgi:signal peptidase II
MSVPHESSSSSQGVTEDPDADARNAAEDTVPVAASPQASPGARPPVNEPIAGPVAEPVAGPVAEPIDRPVERPADEDETDPWVPVAPLKPHRILLLLLVALNGWALDLATKVVAVGKLEGRPPVAVVDGVLYLQLVRNAGAAFAMATGATWLLTLIAVGVVLAIFNVAGRLRSVGWAVALGLVLAGALGNLTDRLFRAPGPLVGRVVDFISLFAPDGNVWPVFNVADSAICLGGAMLVVLALAGRELDGTSTRENRESGGERWVR